MSSDLPPSTPELDDISAKLLARGAAEAVIYLRLGLARVETKLDNALSDQKDFAEFEQVMVREMHLLDKRVLKLEGWQGTLLWVAGIGVTLGGAAAGAIFSYLLSNMGGA